LIVKAVPRCLEWALWGIVRKVVSEELPQYPTSDSLDANVLLQEWKFYLENPHSRLLPPSRTAWYSSVTNVYVQRVRSLNLREDIPLAEILSMIQEERITSYFGFLAQVIRIRDQYVMKGQFGDFALFLQTNGGGDVLRTISSGHLRIATSPSKHVPSNLEIRLDLLMRLIRTLQTKGLPTWLQGGWCPHREVHHRP
jgi:hypothetical protein